MTLLARFVAGLVAALLVPTAAFAQQERPPSTDGDRPTSSRLFVGPTARLLPPGQGYMALYGPIPNFEIGLTDRLQLGGGVLPFAPLFWVTPKVQLFRDERRTVAVGTLQVFAPGEFAGGLAYLNTTRERGNSALSVGAGWAYSTDDGSFRFASGVPVVQLGAERQLTRQWTFVTENYLAVGVGWISGGVRYQRRHFGADFAILSLVGDGGGFAAPMVLVSWRS